MTENDIEKIMKTIATKKEYLSQKNALEDLDICFNLLTTSSASFYNKPKIWTKNSKNSEFAVL